MAEIAIKIDGLSVPPTGPTSYTVGIAVLVVIAVAGLLGLGFLFGRLDREERRAERAAAQERERQLAHLERHGPPGAHRVPVPSLLHEDQTMDLTQYRRIGGVRWH